MSSTVPVLTVVGSRKTPSTMFNHLVDLTALAVVNFNALIRSGGADGADTAAEEGVRKALVEHLHLPINSLEYSENLRRHLRVYLPYDGFRGHRDTAFSPYVDATRFPTYEEAQVIALSVHPAPEHLKRSQFGLQAHTRNVFQDLGAELRHPSAALLCWAAVDKHTIPTGGTRTAWMLAQKYNIPSINLAVDDITLATQRLKTALYAMGNRTHAATVST